MLNADENLATYTTKGRLQMKMEYFLYPYNREIFKEDKGMDFQQHDSKWANLANFILSEKTSMFKDTLKKIKNPDVRDRMIQEVKRVMNIKSTMTQDNFSDPERKSTKKVGFLDYVKQAVEAFKDKKNQKRSNSIVQESGSKVEIEQLEALSPGKRFK